MRLFFIGLSFLCLCLSGCETAKPFTNSIGMEFVLIPPGTFMMGDNAGAGDYEMPQHQVTISQPFYLGKYEVTQAQWMEVMGTNPSDFRGPSNPVENVSWDDIQEFISRLNKREGHNRYRLPTEAEWEYAARGGTDTLFFFTRDLRSRREVATQLDAYAWFDENSGKPTHPVGQKRPNPFGLYDIYGNVSEWVQDWFGAYSGGSFTDPLGPSSGDKRVQRGGSWDHLVRDCRSTYRDKWSPHIGSWLDGFRLALSPE
jgi:formylglycine-generating enzyme required for sulfatase activity